MLPVLQSHRFTYVFLFDSPDFDLSVSACCGQLISVDVESQGRASTRMRNHLALYHGGQLVDLKIFLVLRHVLCFKDPIKIIFT